MLIVGGRELIVAAIATTAACSTVLCVKSDKPYGMPRRIGPILRGYMIQKRCFAVNRLGNLIFRVATEHDMILSVFLQHGCSAHLEMGNVRIGSALLRRVQSSKDLLAQLGVGYQRPRVFSELPRGGRVGAHQAKSGESDEPGHPKGRPFSNTTQKSHAKS